MEIQLRTPHVGFAVYKMLLSPYLNMVSFFSAWFTKCCRRGHSFCVLSLV